MTGISGTSNAIKLNDNGLNFFIVPASTINGLTDFTFSIWLYSITPRISSRNPCVFNAVKGLSQNEFYFCRRNLSVKSSGNFNNADKFPLNTWFHYAVVRNASTGKL